MTHRVIPAEEQRWLTQSFVDPNGRVFEWRGEIYRRLTASYAPLWKDLFAQGFAQELMRDGLMVETEITDFEADAGELILRHRSVPVVSYCFEWSPHMLKDAALVTIDLCIRLAERGMTLQDGHPWNILFDGTKPIFIDLGSVVPARDDILWAPYQQFCSFFVYPLYLYASGRDHIARWLLNDFLNGVTDQDVLAALPLRHKIRHPRRTLGVALPRLFGKMLEKMPAEFKDKFFAVSKEMNVKLSGPKLRLKFFHSLRTKVEKLRLPRVNSPWVRYYGTADRNYFSTDLSPGDWDAKKAVVEKILKEVSAPTVLDVGANTGNYARLAAELGARVVACDLDVPAVDRCYAEFRRDQLNILPLVANVFSTSPTPGRGAVDCPPPVTRFRSDLVLALALMHHVVASQRLEIDRIVNILASLSSRALLLEFVPPLEPKIGASIVPFLDDYSVELVESCLRQRFKSVTRYQSYPAKRALFLCRK